MYPLGYRPGLHAKSALVYGCVGFSNNAFVVFSSMGFYPITPGIPIYTIGSPLFSKIKINLPNGKVFTINAPNCNEKISIFKKPL